MSWTEVSINKSTATGAYIKTYLLTGLKGICDVVRFEEGQEVGGVQAFYAALKFTEEALGGPSVVASVVITERNGEVLRYKPIHETEGPLFYGASPEFIASLTPIESVNANQWRERCLQDEAHKAKVQQAIQKLGA